MAEGSSDNEKQPERTVLVIVSVMAILGGRIANGTLAATIEGSPALSWLMMVNDILTMTGVSYLVYFGGTALWRRWRKHPKPHASPGLPTLGAMFVVWAILVPAAVFGALALTQDGWDDSVALMPTPTVAATAAKASDLSLEDDLAAYRLLLADMTMLDPGNACWSAVGGYEGMYERMGDVDGITVKLEGGGQNVFLEWGASAEAKRIFWSHERLRGDEDRMYAVWDELKEVLKREAILVGSENVEAENLRMSSVLTYHPFNEEEWKEVRALAYEEREATQHYQNSSIGFMELFSPGCSGG